MSITAADVAGFLEKGLLENLVLLFKAEPSLYGHLGELLSDERIVIRLGASALVEGLAEEDPDRTGRAAAALLPLLESVNPVLRGDAAYLLGFLGREEALEPLIALAENDVDAEVRDAAAEAAERVTAMLRGGAPPTKR